jgi:hypothetical protein
MNEPDPPADRTADVAGSQLSLDRKLEGPRPSTTSYRSGHHGEPERLALQVDAHRSTNRLMTGEATDGRVGELIAIEVECADGSLTADRFGQFPTFDRVIAPTRRKGYCSPFRIRSGIDTLVTTEGVENGRWSKMTEVWGADADELDRLAVQFDQVADRLGQTSRGVGASLGAAPWSGRGADLFRDRWYRQFAPDVIQTGAFLSTVATELRKQAAQQRAASEGSGFRDAVGGGLLAWLGDSGSSGSQKINGEELKIEDVKQGGLGDCYLMAALAAMASTESGRRTLAEHCRYDPTTGKWYVTFDGLKGKNGKPLVVEVDDSDALTDKINGEVTTGAVDSAEWVRVYEKAYSKAITFKDLNDGGRAADFFKDITGKSSSVMATEQLYDGVIIRVASAAESNRLVVTASTVDPVRTFGDRLDEMFNVDPGLDWREKTGVVPYHVYTVLGAGVSEETGQQFVEVRNPWGSVEPGYEENRDGKSLYYGGATNEFNKVKAGKNYGGDGVFRLSVDEFRRSFPFITISEL